MTDAYTGRSQEHVIVESFERDDEDNWFSVRFTSGWSMNCPDEVKPLVHEGAEFIQETVQLSRITGMATVKHDDTGEAVVDEWLWHKTDEDLERENREFREKLHREHEELLEANRADWSAREAKLPRALRRRLERFRENGGHRFDRDGWGYELIASELGALYALSDGVDTPEIKEYADVNGTSGNQHGFGKLLGQALNQETEENITNLPAALSPLTGDPDYKKGHLDA